SRCSCWCRSRSHGRRSRRGRGCSGRGGSASASSIRRRPLPPVVARRGSQKRADERQALAEGAVRDEARGGADGALEVAGRERGDALEGEGGLAVDDGGAGVRERGLGGGGGLRRGGGAGGRGLHGRRGGRGLRR